MIKSDRSIKSCISKIFLYHAMYLCYFIKRWNDFYDLFYNMNKKVIIKLFNGCSTAMDIITPIVLLHYRFATKSERRISFMMILTSSLIYKISTDFSFCFNFIFLRSHVITQYIGDTYRVLREKHGYETRWFYDAVITESAFLVGADSRTLARRTLYFR